MKGKLMMVVLTVGMFGLAGCGNDKLKYVDFITHSTVPSVIGSSHIADVEENEIAKTVASGNIYEVTENNFQEGLYYEFSAEEIRKWNSILSKSNLNGSGNKISNDSIKYFVYLYDKNSKEVNNFLIDEGGYLYDKDGLCFYNKDIDDLLSGAHTNKAIQIQTDMK